MPCRSESHNGRPGLSSGTCQDVKTRQDCITRLKGDLQFRLGLFKPLMVNCQIISNAAFRADPNSLPSPSRPSPPLSVSIAQSMKRIARDANVFGTQNRTEQNFFLQAGALGSTGSLNSACIQHARSNPGLHGRMYSQDLSCPPNNEPGEYK